MSAEQTVKEQNATVESQQVGFQTVAELLAAQDPRAEIETLSSEALEQLLTQSEIDVAQAGTALELGIRGSEEVSTYKEVTGTYMHFLSLVVERDLVESFANGEDEKRAAAGVIGFLIESKRRVVGLDLRQRLDDSVVERSKKNLARSKVSRAVGYVMTGAATAGAAYLASKGMDFAATKSGVEDTESMVRYAGVGALLAGGKAVKKVLDRVRDKFHEEVDSYKSSDVESAAQEASLVDDPEEQEAIMLARLHESHISGCEAELFRVAGTRDIVGNEGGFTKELISVFGSSFTEFYRLNEQDTPAYITIASASLAAATGIASENLATEVLSGVVEGAGDGLAHNVAA